MQNLKKLSVKIPQGYLDLINQIFEVEKKVNDIQEDNSIRRNVNKMKAILEDALINDSKAIGLSYHNPIGEPYNDTRTDCDATISGISSENLEIVEVVKPIIYFAYKEEEKVIKTIVQQAVVIVQSKDNNH